MNQPTRTPTEAVEAAVAFFNGNASALAGAIDVSPQLVSFMRRGDRRVPAEKCPAIERLTNGTVRCEELRPDVDWAYFRELVAAAANETWDHVTERRRAAG